MADDPDLEELRRLATLAGFVPFASSRTPWPATRNRSVESLNRHVHIGGDRVRAAAAAADPHGFLPGHQGALDDVLAATEEWTGSVERAVDILADADDVERGGLPAEAIDVVLPDLDRASSGVRRCGKVYLAAWKDFTSEPFPYAVAPLTNVALFHFRWFKAIVRRQSAEEMLNATMSSAGRLHWGAQNLAGTVEDKTMPGLTDWVRELGGFVDAVLAVCVEVTVAAETVVRYER